MPTGSFVIYFDVENDNKYTGTPVAHQTKNDLDAHGTFLDLVRLPQEDGADYYKRLQSVIPLRGGSDQEGLIHGITRELGLEELIGLKITPVTSGGVWRAPAPRIDITSTHIILYSDYREGNLSASTIDLSVDIHSHGSGYLMSDVVSAIQGSEFFVAELGPYMTGKEKANGLVPMSSNTVVPKEWVKGNTYWFFENSDIVPGSISFTEKLIFNTEVSPEAADLIDSGITFSYSVNTPVSKDGEYYIDYINGSCVSYSSSSGRGTCRYSHRNFPMQVRWSPVVVYSLRDDNYKEKVFEDEVMPDDWSYHGLTTAEGSDVFEQTFQGSNSLWGK